MITYIILQTETGLFTHHLGNLRNKFNRNYWNNFHVLPKNSSTSPREIRQKWMWDPSKGMPLWRKFVTYTHIFNALCSHTWGIEATLSLHVLSAFCYAFEFVSRYCSRAYSGMRILLFSFRDLITCYCRSSETRKADISNSEDLSGAQEKPH